MKLFLQDFARPLLVVHALVGVALLGTATHAAVDSLSLLRRRAGSGRRMRIQAQVLGATLVAAFVLGLLLYPTYRYEVRGLYLDRAAVWASNLFDFKENLAAFSLPVGLALFFVGRKLEPGEDGPLLPLVCVLSCACWAMVAGAVVIGLLVTSVKAVS